MSLAARQACSNATGIVLVAAALMTVGLVMVASAGARLDQAALCLRFWETPFGRQAVFTVLGFAALLTVSHGGHRWVSWRSSKWYQPALLLFLVTLACLVAVLIPGVGLVRNGARRWLNLGGGIAFQPSELAKPVMIVLLAAVMSRRTEGLLPFWRGVVPACAVLGSCVALVGIEDFGTAALLAGVGGTMLLMGGMRWRHVALIGVPGATAMAYLVYSEPYRMQRLTVFLDIWKDPQGAGYHPVQSLVTIASGGLTGKGLGGGVQKYGYLPEARTDFIFSVICEETGMFGAFVVIALFVTFLWLGWRVTQSDVSPFGRLLAFGVTALIGLQALINIAVVTVVAPTKGISLPFVSAGGSGVILLGIAVGLLVSVAREPEENEEVHLLPEAQVVMG